MTMADIKVANASDPGAVWRASCHQM